MKISILILTFVLSILILTGCSEDNDSINIQEVLYDNTWIKESFYNKWSEEYVEYENKDEYLFYPNGKYLVKGLRPLYSPTGDRDTVVFDNLEWTYDEKNNIIDFITYHDVTQVENDWKIVEVNYDRIIVQIIWTTDFTDSYNVILKAKY